MNENKIIDFPTMAASAAKELTQQVYEQEGTEIDLTIIRQKTGEVGYAIDGNTSVHPNGVPLLEAISVVTEALRLMEAEYEKLAKDTVE
jgi:hypothetical protein